MLKPYISNRVQFLLPNNKREGTYTKDVWEAAEKQNIIVS